LPIVSVILWGAALFISMASLIGAGGYVLIALMSLVMIYTSISLYISWFRYMFRLEASPSWYRLDFALHGQVVWAAIKQLGFAMLPTFVVCLIGIISGAFGDVENGNPNIPNMLLFTALPIAWLVFAYTRLGLYLPAIALGERVTLRQAFGETKGVFWRLFWLAFLVSLLNMLSDVVEKVMSAFGDTLPVLLVGAVLYALCLWLSLGVSLASSAEVYRAWLVSKNGNEAKPDVAPTSA
jgi:hypothetical protein